MDLSSCELAARCTASFPYSLLSVVGVLEGFDVVCCDSFLPATVPFVNHSVGEEVRPYFRSHGCFGQFHVVPSCSCLCRIYQNMFINFPFVVQYLVAHDLIPSFSPCFC